MNGDLAVEPITIHSVEDAGLPVNPDPMKWRLIACL
jgi:hypothetical protein